MPEEGDSPEKLIELEEEEAATDELIKEEQELVEELNRLRDRRQYLETSSTGRITDVSYDSEHHELAVTVRTPMETDQEFTLEHTETEIGDDLEAFLCYAETDRIADLLGKEVPLFLTATGWKLHLPAGSHGQFRMNRWALDNGYLQYSYHRRPTDGSCHTARLGQKAITAAMASITVFVALSLFVHPVFLALTPLSLFVFPLGRAKLRLV